ncbi:MAG: hypothetical protein DWI54_07520 [Chloroflexi bacterium]|nr:MAG: hypothetical protein DWI54_07520 [Chloroflexota bacterium]
MHEELQLPQQRPLAVVDWVGIAHPAHHGQHPHGHLDQDDHGGQTQTQQIYGQTAQHGGSFG